MICIPKLALEIRDILLLALLLLPRLDDIFHQPCSLWNAPCVHGCGYIHLWSSTHGSRKKCCANGCLSSASDNFDKELMMDHDLDKLPQFLRQVITLSPEFLKKFSTYNNLVAMAATVYFFPGEPTFLHRVLRFFPKK
jgi:hypothetical protein